MEKYEPTPEEGAESYKDSQHKDYEDLFNAGEQLPSDISQHTRNQVSLKNEELDRSVKKEAKALEQIADTNEEIDQFYRQSFEKTWGLLEKWTNRKMYDQVQEVKKDLVKVSAGYRMSFYRTFLDARLEALREKCNSGLKCIKSYHRQQVASFVMAKMEGLRIEVKNRQMIFFEMMKEKYSYAESLKPYPTMHQRFMNSIFKEEANYLQFLDSLVSQFESIVDEEIRKY